jgi:phosphinothricin acetyltransferase
LGGSGIGSRLYSELFLALKSFRAYTVIGGLHCRTKRGCAFTRNSDSKKVTRFGQLGFKFNRWIDVTHWQLAL